MSMLELESVALSLAQPQVYLPMVHILSRYSLKRAEEERNEARNGQTSLLVLGDNYRYS